jgi:hypothetical protein
LVGATQRRESKGGNVPSESQVVDRNGQVGNIANGVEFLQESQPGLGLAHMTHGPESGSSLERRYGFVGQRSPHFVEVSAVTKEPDGQTPNQIKVSSACALEHKTARWCQQWRGVYAQPFSVLANAPYMCGGGMTDFFL